MKRTLKRIKQLQSEKKFLRKIFLFFLLATFSYAGLYGYEHYLDSKSINEQIAHIKENIAKNKVAKFDNVEEKIFDLGQDNEIKIVDLEDLTQEKKKASNPGADRITALEKEVASLKVRVEEISHLNRKSAIILSYVRLRNKIFAHFDSEDSYLEELQNFDLLSRNDPFLAKRFRILTSHLRYHPTQESLIDEFEKLADQFSTQREFNSESKLLNKIKSNLSKVIVIRKIDQSDSNIIDSKIVTIMENLKNQNYIRANHMILSLDNKYRIISGPFLMKLNHMIALRRADSEIMNYLLNNS